MKKKFEIPTIREVEKFARSIGYKSLDAAHWWHFYNSKNWMVGKSKMSSWKSAVWTWFLKTDEYKDIKAREIEKEKTPEPEEPFVPADPEKVAAGKKKMLKAIRPAYYGIESKAAKEKRIQEDRRKLLRTDR